MKKFLLFLMALVASVTMGAQEVTLDFTSNEGWNFPVGKDNIASEPAQFTNGDYTVTLEGGASGTGYYYNADGYIIVGKEGASLTLPAFDFAVSKIEFVGRSGASASTLVNVFVDGKAVSTQTKGSTATCSYEIAADKQAAGTIYQLKVLSGHNAQFTKINIYKAEPKVVAVSFDPAMKELVTLSVNDEKVDFAPSIEMEEGTKVSVTPVEDSNVYSVTVNGNPIAKEYPFSSDFVFYAAAGQQVACKQLSEEGGKLTVYIDLPEDDVLVQLGSNGNDKKLSKGVNAIEVEYQYLYGSFVVNPALMIGIAEEKVGEWIIKEMEYTMAGSQERFGLYNWTEDGGNSALISVIGDMYGSPYIRADYTFYPMLKNIAEARSATATLTIVGDREIYLFTGDNPREIEGHKVDIKFDPEEEQHWRIMAQDYDDLGSVTRNGEEIDSYDGQYEIYYVEDGDQIEVNTILDKSDKTIKFVFADETSRKAVKSVKYYNEDYREIEFKGWDAPEGITVEYGKQILVYFDTDNYNLETLTENGKDVEVYGAYIYRTVKKDLTYFVKAAAYEKATVDIEIVDPAHVLVGMGAEGSYSADMEVTGLVAGNNNVEYSTKMTQLFIEPTLDATIVSVKAVLTSGETVDVEETYEGSKTYIVALADVTKVIVDSKEIARDSKVTIWCDAVPYGYYVQRPDYYYVYYAYTDDESMHLQPGENVFYINEEIDNPITISCYDEAYDSLPLYLNDVKQEDWYGYTLELHNGDIIKIYANGDPSGIKDVKINESDDVFNIQGMKMNDNKNLPAGIYVVGGKKFIVK